MNLFELMGVKAPIAEEKKEPKKAAKKAAKPGAKPGIEKKYRLPSTFNVLGIEEVEVTPEMAGLEDGTEASEKDIIAALHGALPWIVTDKHLYVEEDCVLVRLSAGTAKGALKQRAEAVFLGKEDLASALPATENGYDTAEAVISAVKKVRPGYQGIITGLTEGADGSVRIEIDRKSAGPILMPKESISILTLGGDCIVLLKDDCRKICNVKEESVTEFSALDLRKLAAQLPWKCGKEHAVFVKIGDDSYLAVTTGKKNEVSSVKTDGFDIASGAVIFDNGNEIPVTPEDFSGKTQITQDDVRDFLVNEHGRRHYNVMPIVVTEFKKDDTTYLHVGVKSSTKGAYDKHPFSASVRMEP